MSNNNQPVTLKSQEAMQAAAQKAETLFHSVVEPEHLLYELVEQDQGMVPRILEEIKIKPTQALSSLNVLINKFSKLGSAPSQVYASQRLQKIFKASEQEMKWWQDELISTEHFLLAMLKSDDSDLKNLFKVIGLNTNQTQEILKKNKRK